MKSVYLLKVFFKEYRFIASFLSMAIAILLLDFLANALFPTAFFQHLYNSAPILKDISFAPEVWLGVVGLVLGTLIIIITIASQMIPRLIDLYMNDMPSLFFGWLIILSALHTILIVENSRPASSFLNVYFLLPISLIFVFPYVFYILKQTKPSAIIRNLSKNAKSVIKDLTKPGLQDYVDIPKNAEAFQISLLTSMNQLDNIFHSVNFKEYQAQTVRITCELVRDYIEVKRKFPVNFFTMSDTIEQDTSFQTLSGQYQEIQDNKTFFEVKCFRILGDAYFKFLNINSFDLASLCGSELVKIGKKVCEVDDDNLISLVLIRFNTMMRFAIKDGSSKNDPRNLYTLAYHYGKFIEQLIVSGKVAAVKQAVWYLQWYSSQVYLQSQMQKNLMFISAVLTSEMKNLLILVYKLDWDIETQVSLVSGFLKMDNPIAGGSNNTEVILTQVLQIQVSLCLFYLDSDTENSHLLSNLIIEDICKDLKSYPKQTAEKMVKDLLFHFKIHGPMFWEDTERGTSNIFYSPHTSQLSTFEEKITSTLQ